MPVTKTAKRALRSSARKDLVNRKVLTSIDLALRSFKKSPTEKSASAAFSKLDKAAKKKVIHKNKASRLKSRVRKALVKKEKTKPSKTIKK